MTPASVPSRLPGRALLSVTAAVALLLPAATARAQSLPPGTLDLTFNAGALGATVYALDYAADLDNSVKLTLGGDRALGEYFLANPNLLVNPLSQPNGIPSATFVLPNFGNAARTIYTIVPERMTAPDSSLPNLLLGGLFGRPLIAVANGALAQNIIRVRPDGTLDTGFATAVGTGANNFVTSILPQDDGRIVVGGQFTTFNGQPRRRIVRLLNSGGIDQGFATGSNIDNDVLTLAAGIDPASGLTDGSTLVGGSFNHVSGLAYAKLVRLDPNGNLDPSFHPNIDLRVLTILVQQPSGKIIIGGDFTSINGVRVSRLARLNHDGSLDTTFAGSVSGVPNKDVNPTAVYVLKAISDGRIYVGGEFAYLDGVARQYLGLMSADGVLDTTFDPLKYVYDSVQTIAVQSDNNILIGETLGPKLGKVIQPSVVRLIGVTPGGNTNVGVTTQRAQPEAAVPPEAAAPPAARAAGGSSYNSGQAVRRYIW